MKHTRKIAEVASFVNFMRLYVFNVDDKRRGWIPDFLIRCLNFKGGGGGGGLWGSFC